MRAEKKVVVYPAIVTWRDAHADGPSWMSHDDIDDEPYVVDTIGWVHEDVKTDHVTLAQSRGRDGAIDHVIHIPNAMVIDVRRIPHKSKEFKNVNP